MKTIGLIGGMSWESTQTYYRILNTLARERLGGLHSAQLVLWSFDFAEIESLQVSGNWDAATREMVAAARAVERAGAECILICTNTMHKMAGVVQDSVDIPLIHIADVSATAIKSSGARKPLLLATRFTMEQDFYRRHLLDHHGVETCVPDDDGRTLVHEVIYNELCRGIVRDASRRDYLEVVSRATKQGADGVIFGCTEVGLLLSPSDVSLPVFDTTELHAIAAMDFALG